MKIKSLAIAALLGLVDLTSAISEHSGKKGMVSIGLTKTSYNNQRVNQRPLSNEMTLALSEALNLPVEKEENGAISLIQRSKKLKNKNKPVDIPMANMMNMGYEGSFWYGTPPQKMEVIFDTGSAWAWLFSETCKDSNCPTQNKKYAQSKSKDFKMNPKGGQFLAYGKGQILGHPSEDTACFSGDGSKCLHHFNFLTVVKGKDLAGLRGSGLIGLAPTPAQDKEITDPMNNGIAGFVAQLKKSSEFNKDFDPIFSIYLTNDGQSPGDVTFGGYDLAKFAQKGAKDKDIIWADQAANEAYWAVNTKSVEFGGNKNFATYNQQVIFDNGMSLAMAPEKSFVELVKNLYQNYGVQCQETQPVWSCNATPEQYQKLPSMTFNVITAPGGETKQIQYPKEAYMKMDEEQKMALLLITPWQFQGLGGKDGEEYWVLGAQFLQNYYTIYDFKNKKVGLVQSVTSVIKN